ncbi:MAG: hypothetical protein GEV10_26245 [Streptosporangiales bacterium]|nr:hypothetical protein [Streptosporangiales bacterium]
MSSNPGWPEVQLEKLFRRITDARVALIRAQATRDKAEDALVKIGETQRPHLGDIAELDPDHRVADAARALADADRQIRQHAHVLAALERGLPITVIASYHAGRLAAHRAQGRTDPILHGRPGALPDWMWDLREGLTPAEQSAAVRRQHDAFTRRN